MGTQTDTPRIVVASFSFNENGTTLAARTEDGVDIQFRVDPMALAVMGLTIDGALRQERDKLRSLGEMPKHPQAPDSTEGLEG